MSLSVQTKHISAIEIHQQLITVTGGDEMIVQCVGKWRREFENGRPAGRRWHRTDVAAARMEEPTAESRRTTTGD